jgi:hypothetical protein
MGPLFGAMLLLAALTPSHTSATTGGRVSVQWSQRRGRIYLYALWPASCTDANGHVDKELNAVFIQARCGGLIETHAVYLHASVLMIRSTSKSRTHVDDSDFAFVAAFHKIVAEWWPRLARKNPDGLLINRVPDNEEEEADAFEELERPRCPRVSHARTSSVEGTDIDELAEALSEATGREVDSEVAVEMSKLNASVFTPLLAAATPLSVTAAATAVLCTPLMLRSSSNLQGRRFATALWLAEYDVVHAVLGHPAGASPLRSLVALLDGGATPAQRNASLCVVAGLADMLDDNMAALSGMWMPSRRVDTAPLAERTLEALVDADAPSRMVAVLRHAAHAPVCDEHAPDLCVRHALSHDASKALHFVRDVALAARAFDRRELAEPMVEAGVLPELARLLSDAVAGTSAPGDGDEHARASRTVRMITLGALMALAPLADHDSFESMLGTLIAAASSGEESDVSRVFTFLTDHVYDAAGAQSAALARMAAEGALRGTPASTGAPSSADASASASAASNASAAMARLLRAERALLESGVCGVLASLLTQFGSGSGQALLEMAAALSSASDREVRWCLASNGAFGALSDGLKRDAEKGPDDIFPERFTATTNILASVQNASDLAGLVALTDLRNSVGMLFESVDSESSPGAAALAHLLDMVRCAHARGCAVLGSPCRPSLRLV